MSTLDNWGVDVPDVDDEDEDEELESIAIIDVLGESTVTEHAVGMQASVPIGALRHLEVEPGDEIRFREGFENTVTVEVLDYDD